MTKQKPKPLEILLKKGPANFRDIKLATGMTKKTAILKVLELQAAGVPIDSYSDKKTFETYFYLAEKTNLRNAYNLNLKDGNYLFGATSDKHFGDDAFRLDYLLKAYDTYDDRGVECVFDCGDIITGISVYRGQHAELTHHTIHGQIDYVVDDHPALTDNKKTVLITGNHDLNDLLKSGDPGVIIERRRKDFEYIGQVNQVVKVANNMSFNLVHYKGSMPYALSYRAQKYIRDGLKRGYEFSDVLLMGHKHIVMYALVQGVHAFECGTFQGVNRFAKERNLPNMIASWLIEVDIENGMLKKIKPELLLFE